MSNKFREAHVSLDFFGFQPHQLAQRRALPSQSKRIKTWLVVGSLFINIAVQNNEGKKDLVIKSSVSYRYFRS